MEKSRLEEWLTEFNKQIDNAFRFSFPVRDLILQQEAVNKLEDYHTKVDEERLKLRQKKDSDSANMFLGMSCYTQSVIHLLKMWIAIREDDPDYAWDMLIGAEQCASASMRAHQNCAAHLVTYPNYLETLEHILFPKQQFASSSFLINNSECSLCSAPFHECDHIAGFPYNGEFCVEIVNDIADIDHVALVDHPDDKCCRTYSIVEDGYEVDLFTLKRIHRNKD